MDFCSIGRKKVSLNPKSKHFILELWPFEAKIHFERDCMNVFTNEMYMWEPWIKVLLCVKWPWNNVPMCLVSQPLVEK